MAFLHHHPHSYAAGQGFGPLFRMLEDYDRYSSGNNAGRTTRAPQTFQPKFDVRETDKAYELHGELAGMTRDNVRIEFSDPQNLTVRGRIERSYTSGTPPAGLVEGGEQQPGAITEGGEGGEGERPGSPSKGHKVTVEDEAEDEATEGRASTAAPTPGSTVAEPVRTKNTDISKYWVSERSIGEFTRSFNFPQRVDQDGVTANLKDGILSIIVPKAKKHEARRIAVN